MSQVWMSRGLARVVSRMPMGIALGAVAAVWVLGCVWSFTEQTGFATAKGFSDPMLLPLVIDGLAAAMGGVAFAASLDARPAVAARVGTTLAVLASATSNGLWAAERSTGPAGPDPATVAIGVGIPIAANIAFEVLLAELRRQVQRRRGLPAPVPLPTLRVARLLLDPGPTFRQWRRLVLDTTDPASAATDSASDAGPEPPARQERSWPPPEPSGPGPNGPGGLPLPAAEQTATTSTGHTALPPESPALVGATATSDGSPPPSEPAQASMPDSQHGEPVDPAPERGVDEPTDAGREAERPNGHESSGGGESGRPETNSKVWRLAEYVRERGQDPEALTGEEVVELGLCSSTRNGRRLKDRAVALCAALDGPTPPPRPDLAATPRLLLPGESPSLALVAREDAR